MFELSNSGKDRPQCTLSIKDLDGFYMRLRCGLK